MKSMLALALVALAYLLVTAAILRWHDSPRQQERRRANRAYWREEWRRRNRG